MDIKKLFHQTVGRGIAVVKEKRMGSEFSALNPGEYYVGEKPEYVSQLADANPGSIQGFYGNISDKEASNRFGAINLKEFSYWAWRSCGIAGVQMALQTLITGFQKKTMDLVEEGLKFNGYDIKRDLGWYHSALVAIVKKHGLDARTEKYVSSTEIAKLVLSEKYSLASIKSDTGGHLLLIYGFKMGNDHKIEGFVVHDPNNFKTKGDGKFISKSDFDKLFTRRIVVISKK